MATSLGNGKYRFDRNITVHKADGTKLTERMTRTFNAASANKAAIIEEGMIERRKKEMLGEIVEAPKAMPTFTAFVTEWEDKYGKVAYAKREKMWIFIQDRLKQLKGFLDLCNAPLDKIDNKMVDLYQTHRRIAGVGDATLNRDFSVLRLILKKAQLWYGLKELPKFPRFKEATRDRVVQPHEEEIYLAAAPPILSTLAKIMIDTGIEPGVIAEMDWQDVHFEAKNYVHGYIHARGTKTIKHGPWRERDVPMTARLRTFLKTLWMEQGRPTKGLLMKDHIEAHSFDTAHRRLWGMDVSKPRPAKRPRKKEEVEKTYLTIPYFRLYDLRHTALTRMGEAGISEQELMIIAGWSPKSAMQMLPRYVHPTAQRMAKAMSRMDAYLASQQQAADEA
jgi:integrase